MKPPPPVAANHSSRIDERAGKLFNIKGIALGLCKSYLTELRRRILDVEEVCEQPITALFRQSPQRYLCVAVGVVGLGGLLYTPGRRLALVSPLICQFAVWQHR
jgi:hypothetical protein